LGVLRKPLKKMLFTLLFFDFKEEERKNCLFKNRRFLRKKKRKRKE
jgi:hypothetical protein